MYKTAQYFPRTPWGAMGIKFFDYDNDGRIDLLITDMHSDMSREPGTDNEKAKADVTWTDDYLQGKKSDFIFGNALYHNLGDGKIEEVSDKMGVENYWPWGVSVGDINADGWDDIFIASGMSFPYRYGVNSLLLNDHGQKFRDSEFILGIEPRKNLYSTLHRSRPMRHLSFPARKVRVLPGLGFSDHLVIPEVWRALLDRPDRIAARAAHW